MMTLAVQVIDQAIRWLSDDDIVLLAINLPFILFFFATSVSLPILSLRTSPTIIVLLHFYIKINLSRSQSSKFRSLFRNFRDEISDPFPIYNVVVACMRKRLFTLKLNVLMKPKITRIFTDSGYGILTNPGYPGFELRTHVCTISMLSAHLGEKY